MLPQSKRLSRKQVEDVLKTGRRHSSAYFFTTISRAAHQSTPGFAVVVSKKTAPTAVLRNKLRRRVYSVVRSIIDARGTPPFSAVITVKREAINTEFAAFSEDLTRLLTSARV